MPTQFFRVTRAPEAKEITPKEIKHALMDIRSDTEWDVKEFIQPGKRIEVNGITYVAKKEKKKHACTGCDLFTWERRCWAGEALMCNGIIWKKVKELDKPTGEREGDE